MAEDWKSVEDVIKTEGSILEIGSFVSQSGNKVDISPEDADTLFNNITSSLPFVVLHEDGYQEAVGYATDFLKTENGIDHKGIAFNNDKFKSAMSMGCNSISPVIDFEKDPSGKITSAKIVKLAFVPNPAMSQNRVNMSRFAFSAPEVNSMTNPEGETVNIQGTQVPTTTFVQPEEKPAQAPASIDPELLKNIASSIADGVAAKFNTQIEALTAEITELKSKQVAPTAILTETEPVIRVQEAVQGEQQTIPQEVLDQLAKLQADNKIFQEKLEKEERAAYKSKLAELRTLGQDNPEKLVAHLKDTKSKIDTLDALKVAIIKNQPMNSPNTTPLSAGGGKNQSTKQPTVLGLADSLKMRIDAETATKLSQKLRIPVQ